MDGLEWFGVNRDVRKLHCNGRLPGLWLIVVNASNLAHYVAIPFSYVDSSWAVGSGINGIFDCVCVYALKNKAWATTPPL